MYEQPAWDVEAQRRPLPTRQPRLQDRDGFVLALVQKHLQPLGPPAVGDLGHAVDQTLHAGGQFGHEGLQGVLAGAGPDLRLDLGVHLRGGGGAQTWR